MSRYLPIRCVIHLRSLDESNSALLLTSFSSLSVADNLILGKIFSLQDFVFDEIPGDIPDEI